MYYLLSIYITAMGEIFKWCLLGNTVFVSLNCKCATPVLNGHIIQVSIPVVSVYRKQMYTSAGQAQLHVHYEDVPLQYTQTSSCMHKCNYYVIMLFIMFMHVHVVTHEHKGNNYYYVSVHIVKYVTLYCCTFYTVQSCKLNIDSYCRQEIIGQMIVTCMFQTRTQDS